MLSYCLVEVSVCFVLSSFFFYGIGGFVFNIIYGFIGKIVKFGVIFGILRVFWREVS